MKVFVRVKRIRHGTVEEDERRRKGGEGDRDKERARKSIGLDCTLPDAL